MGGWGLGRGGGERTGAGGGGPGLGGFGCGRNIESGGSWNSGSGGMKKGGMLNAGTGGTWNGGGLGGCCPEVGDELIGRPVGDEVQKGVQLFDRKPGQAVLREIISAVAAVCIFTCQHLLWVLTVKRSECVINKCSSTGLTMVAPHEHAQ